jgi:hypothetical protein
MPWADSASGGLDAAGELDAPSRLGLGDDAMGGLGLGLEATSRGVGHGAWSIPGTSGLNATSAPGVPGRGTSTGLRLGQSSLDRQQ